MYNCMCVDLNSTVFISKQHMHFKCSFRANILLKIKLRAVSFKNYSTCDYMRAVCILSWQLIANCLYATPYNYLVTVSMLTTGGLLIRKNTQISNHHSNCR